MYDGITRACEGFPPHSILATHGMCFGCKCICHEGVYLTPVEVYIYLNSDTLVALSTHTERHDQ